MELSVAFVEGWESFWPVEKPFHSEPVSFMENIRSRGSSLPSADLFRQRLAGLHKNRMDSRKPGHLLICDLRIRRPWAFEALKERKRREL